MAVASGETETFEEPKSDLIEHYASIGRLITSFSNIERQLSIQLRELIGITELTGRALTGEMRATDACSTIRRILTAQWQDLMLGQRTTIVISHESKVMDQLFIEISTLKEIRDLVAHQRFFVKENRMAFTNYDTARTLAATKMQFYSVDDLNEFAKYADRLAKRTSLLRLPYLPEAAEPSLLEIPAQLRPKDRKRDRGKDRR